jgi:hypothetical protein
MPLNVEIESSSIHPGSCRGRHAPRHSPPAAAASPYGQFGPNNARRDGPPAAPGHGWRARHGNQWRTSHPGCHQPAPQAHGQPSTAEPARQEESAAPATTAMVPPVQGEKAPEETTTMTGSEVEQALENKNEEKPAPLVETRSEVAQPVVEDTGLESMARDSHKATSPIETSAASDEVASVEAEEHQAILNVTFVDDVSIPDKTPLPPAAEFTKVWKLENSGNVVIPAGTPVIFVGGEKFSHKEGSVRVEEDVPVGGKFLVSLAGLRAPKVSGEIYTGFWRLSDGEGQLFGDKLWTE